MKVLSVDAYFKILKSKSLILNPGRGKAINRPTSTCPIVGVDGLRTYLAEILDESTDHFGYPRGLLATARLRVKELLERFEALNKRQIKPKKGPDGLQL